MVDSMPDAVTLAITIYKCSGCTLMNSAKSRITWHIRNTIRCRDAWCQEQTVSLAWRPQSLSKFVDSGEVDLLARIRNRLPSGLTDPEDVDTVGVDERTDYLCSSPDVLAAVFQDRMPSFRHPSIECAVRLFTHLWGSQAPPCFRSVFVYKGIIHDVYKTDTHVRFMQYKHREEINAFLANMWVIMRDICYAVSRRCMSNAIVASTAAAFVQATPETSPLQMADVLERNKTYERHRKTCKDVVTLAMLFRKHMVERIRSTHV